MKSKAVVRTRISMAVAVALGAGLGVGVAPVANAQQVQRIEVTGSAIRQIEGETALPVTIISVDDLQKQGISSAEAAAQAIVNNQSFVGTAQAVGATTGGRAAIDLRGLGTGRTLVLLNGRRMANHATAASSADLNAIPMAAVERIEILRDGGSALYGTDAIGGVVNFILKRDFKGIEVSAWRDMLGERAGDSMGYSMVAGGGSLANDGASFLGVFNYRHQETISSQDRDYANTGIRPDLFSQPRDSGTPFPANISQSGSTLAALNPARVNGGNCPPFAFNNTNPATLNCRYDFTRLIDLQPRQEQVQIYGKFSKKFGDHVASLEYSLATNDVLARVAPAPLTGMVLPPTSPFFPGGAAGVPAIGGLDTTRNLAFNLRNVPGGQRTSESQAVQDRWVLALEGTLWGWDYNTGYVAAKSNVAEVFTNGYVVRSAFQNAVTAGLVNPFGAQTAAGQAAIDATKITAKVVDATLVTHGVDAKISKDIAQLPAGPLALALGAEYRQEDFKFLFPINPATGQTWGSSAASSGLEGAVDSVGKRDMKAFYAEINVPIIKKMLDGQISARYDDYQLSGDSVTPKVGLRFQPTQALMFRGSWNKGFRAPTLPEIFDPFQTTFTSNSYDDPLLCPGGVVNTALGGQQGRDCAQQPNRAYGGPVGLGLSPDALKPEKSKTWTVGGVWEPTRDLSMGLDYWNINVKGTIGTFPEQAIYADPAGNASKFVRCNAVSAANLANPQIAATCFDENGVLQPNVLAYILSPNTNLGDVKTQGWDVALKWRFRPSQMGTFTLGLNGTYVSKYNYQREKGGAWIQNVGKFSDAGPIIRWQHNASLNWDYGAWTTTLSNRYKGGYEDENAEGQGNKVGDYSVWDLMLSYKGMKNLTINMGIKNLANKEPPASNHGTTFQTGYDPRIADVYGRTYVARLSYKF